ncbi:MAG: hypothetical protein KF747_03630 [Nitrospira sp.]|nr:hypothetical protein [Nitrospira sp.]
MRLLSLLLGLCIAMLLSINSPAEAACSGSGATWTCSAGSTVSQINTALGSASDGATITFQTGSYTINSTIDNFSQSKAVTLKCETVQACTFSGANVVMFNITYSGSWPKLYRISGFNFTGTCPSNCITIYTISSGSTGTLNNFRFDNNRITNMPYTWIQIGATDRGGEVYGVLDHNAVTGTNAHFLVHILGKGSVSSGVVWGPTSRGSADVLYVEDNTFNFNDAGAALNACVDEWLSGKMVARYNTALNCRFQTHGMAHGGAELWEVYRNDIRVTSASGNSAGPLCYACIQSQGVGEMFVFENTLRGLSSVGGDSITTQDYRSGTAQPGDLGLCDGTKSYDGNFSSVSTYRGYPCKGQPGFMESNGNPGYGKSSPIVAFKNVNGHTGAKIDLTIRSNGSPEYWQNHLVANRDYYNAVSANAQSSSTSPFNGTSGVGFGTLANRPTTCTHTTLQNGDEGGGVMYWATDQGSWNQSGDGRGNGVLYRCSATNTWIVHYTPYAYPHPLVSGSGSGSGSGATTPPPAPTNLSVQ